MSDPLLFCQKVWKNYIHLKSQDHDLVPDLDLSSVGEIEYTRWCIFYTTSLLVLFCQTQNLWCKISDFDILCNFLRNVFGFYVFDLDRLLCTASAATHKELFR